MSSDSGVSSYGGSTSSSSGPGRSGDAGGPSGDSGGSHYRSSDGGNWSGDGGGASSQSQDGGQWSGSRSGESGETSTGKSELSSDSFRTEQFSGDSDGGVGRNDSSNQRDGEIESEFGNSNSKYSRLARELTDLASGDAGNSEKSGDSSLQQADQKSHHTERDAGDGKTESQSDGSNTGDRDFSRELTAELADARVSRELSSKAEFDALIAGDSASPEQGDGPQSEGKHTGGDKSEGNTELIGQLKGLGRAENPYELLSDHPSGKSEAQDSQSGQEADNRGQEQDFAQKHQDTSSNKSEGNSELVSQLRGLGQAENPYELSSDQSSSRSESQDNQRGQEADSAGQERDSVRIERDFDSAMHQAKLEYGEMGPKEFLRELGDGMKEVASDLGSKFKEGFSQLKDQLGQSRHGDSSQTEMTPEQIRDQAYKEIGRELDAAVEKQKFEELFENPELKARVLWQVEESRKLIDLLFNSHKPK